MESLEDRVAVVTGASGGIGRALVGALCGAGARVVAVGSRVERVEAALREHDAPEDRVLARAADLAEPDAIEGLADAVLSECGGVDLLVHAAGVHEANPIALTSLAEWDRMQAINVRAPFLLTRALLASLVERRGQVAFLNSSVGQRARGGVGAYAASKHALAALADALRDEVNEQGVRVLTLFVGRTASPMQERVHADEGREYRPERLLQPEDVARSLVAAFELERTAEVTRIDVRPMRKA